MNNRNVACIENVATYSRSARSREKIITIEAQRYENLKRSNKATFCTEIQAYIRQNAVNFGVIRSSNGEIPFTCSMFLRYIKSLTSTALGTHSD